MCDCIDEMNKRLKERGFNTQVNYPIMLWDESGKPIDGKRCILETVKLDDKKREKPKSILAKYCPFCGEKYSD